jgi:hypothetical protein
MAENDLNDMTARAIAGEAIAKAMAVELHKFGQLRPDLKAALESNAYIASGSLLTGKPEIDDAIIVHIRKIMWNI